MSGVRLLRRLACALALAGTTLAASAREVPPPLGVPRPFLLPAVTDTRLTNGMAATLVPFGTVPKAAVKLTFETGNVDDGAKTGLADLVAELLKEGAGARDAAGLARYAAEMGGSLEIEAGPDQTTLALDVLAERAADAVLLLADVARRARLPAAELPRLKANLVRQSAIARSQAQGVAGEALARLLWGDSPYGRTLPSEAAIVSITIGDVRAFVAARLGAVGAHLYVGGRFDADAVERAIATGFGDLATGSRTPHVAPAGSRLRRVQLIDRPGAAQSTIMLALPLPSVATPEFIRLSVANLLLGGTLLSRLNQNLREDKGYTYGASSHVTPFAGFAQWTLATDVDTPATAPAVTEIYREIDRLRAAPPPADELRRTQNYRAGTFVLGAASRAGLLAQLAFIDQQHLPADWLTSYVQRLYAVTPAQVREASLEYLEPAAMTLVVVGDLKQIKPALLALPALAGAVFE